MRFVDLQKPMLLHDAALPSGGLEQCTKEGCFNYVFTSKSDKEKHIWQIHGGLKRKNLDDHDDMEQAAKLASSGKQRPVFHQPRV